MNRNNKDNEQSSTVEIDTTVLSDEEAYFDALQAIVYDSTSLCADLLNWSQSERMPKSMREKAHQLYLDALDVSNLGREWIH